MKTLLSAALLAAALFGPALAAPGDNPVRRLEWVGTDGKAGEMAYSDAQKTQWFKDNAKQVAPGTLIMSIDGSMYILQDYKLSDGRMVSQMLTR